MLLALRIRFSFFVGLSPYIVHRLPHVTLKQVVFLETSEDM